MRVLKASGLFVAVALLTLGLWTFRSTLLDAVNAIRALGSIGFLVYAAAFTVLALCPVPLMPLTMIGGFLMGVESGFLYLYPAAIAAAIIGHWFGEVLLVQHLEHFIRKSPRFEHLRSAVARNGWRAVALNRMLPFCPFAIQNYFLGAAGLRKRDQGLGTALGILPAFLLGLYAGSLAEDLTQAFENQSTKVEGLKKLLLLLSLCALVYTLRWIVKTWNRSRRESHP